MANRHAEPPGEVFPRSWCYHDFYARLGRLGRVGLVVVWVVWVYARLGRVGLVVVFRFWKVGAGIVWGFCGCSR